MTENAASSWNPKPRGLPLAWLLLSLWGGGCRSASPGTVAATEPPAAHAHSSARPSAALPVQLKLLAINDLHGQLEAGLTQEGRPVGGAAVLAAYVRQARRGFEGRELFLLAGDTIGASPPSSGLLQDEPTVAFTNLLANQYCVGPKRDDPRCNVVMTAGNHEFDEGKIELRRLFGGGAHPTAMQFREQNEGARFPLISSNVLVAASGQPLLAPYVIREIGKVRLGVVGAITRETPMHVIRSGVEGLDFDDEAASINRAVSALKRAGIAAIVVLLHEGDESLPPYEGATKDDARVGPVIGEIVQRLDDAVDVVVTGHAHGFTNAFAPNRGGRPVLVTQAFAKGTALAEIDVVIDGTGDITRKTARIVTTYGDVPPGSQPDSTVAALVSEAVGRVRPITSVVVARAQQTLSAVPNDSGESVLGNLVADAQRAKYPSDVAMTNAGGIRADLPAGDITWGQAYAVQPFANSLVRIRLTGGELKAYLEAQVAVGAESRRLHAVSGLSYEWDPRLPLGQRIRHIVVGASPLESERRYTLTVNAYMAAQRGPKAIPCAACEPEMGPSDLDALVEHLKSLPVGFEPPRLGRIRRADVTGQ